VLVVGLPLADRPGPDEDDGRPEAVKWSVAAPGDAAPVPAADGAPL